MCMNVISAADLKLRRNLSFSEDSDLSCDDVLERSSQKSKADVGFVTFVMNCHSVTFFFFQFDNFVLCFIFTIYVFFSVAHALKTDFHILCTF